MQAAAPPSDEPELYDMRSMMANQKALAYVRTISTIASGFAAGILGLTGFKGFAFFACLYVATSVAIATLKMGGKVTTYVPKVTAMSFLVSGLTGEALAFVLYWTLMYALVHIY